MATFDFSKLAVKSYNELIDNRGAAMVGDRIKLPPGIVTQEQVDEALLLSVNHGDIFVTSYPKSGTTWLQAVVWWIMNVQKTDAERESIQSMSPPTMNELKRLHHRFIDLNGVANVDKLPIPRVLVSHLPYEFVPKVSTTENGHFVVKYIHIIRDPKDVVISYFHFFQMLFKLPDHDLDLFVDHFIRGSGIYGDYFDCIKSWWNRKDDSNVLILFYEEMLVEPEKHVMKIASFLSDESTNYDEVLKSNPKIVERIVGATSFNSMKESHLKGLNQGNRGFEKFFRKGIKGDWKHFLKQSQVDAINDRIKNELDESFVDMYVK